MTSGIVVHHIKFAVAALAVLTATASSATAATSNAPPPAAPAPVIADRNMAAVGDCVWRAVGEAGREKVVATIDANGEFLEVRDALNATLTYTRILAGCDPRMAQHQHHSAMLMISYAMKEATAEVLARRGLPRADLDAAWQAAPATLHAAVKAEAQGRFKGDTGVTAIDWAPFFDSLMIDHEMLSGSRAWLVVSYILYSALCETVAERYAA